MRVIIYGPQGSGKTTQAKLLGQKYNLVTISAGEVSRLIAAEDTDEGRLVKSLIDNGKLTPDDVLFRRLKIIFASPQAQSGFVLDGFPRNPKQFVQIDNYLRENNLKLDKVIVITLPEELGIKRIMSRSKIENRADDNPEAIKVRLQIFHQQTGPIIIKYKQQGIVAEVDGSGTIEEVFALIEKIFA